MSSKKNIKKLPNINFKIRIIIFLGIINVVLLVVYVLLTHYAIKNVIVDGNRHYSASEIQSMVMTGYFGDNSLYLSMKYKKKESKSTVFGN